MSALEPELELEASTCAPDAPPIETTGSNSLRELRVRMILAIGLAALGLTCLLVKWFDPLSSLSDQSYGAFMNALLPRVQRFVADWSLTSMLVYPAGLLGILILERLYPAVRTQKTVSTGLVHDAIWVLIEATAVVLVLRVYGRLLSWIYSNYLDFLTIPFARSLPVLLTLAIAIVVLDLTRWCQHWLHHHVSWLWSFHAVHHAQRELNLFSDHRIHIVEHLVRRPISVLPMLMLGLEAPEVTWWLLLLSWHSRLYHANIKSNFGPLRYVFVTPQSHRVHHSLEPQHFDHNYGAMFSVWDYLFGTQFRGYDVYPATGIHDESFPAESARSVLGVFKTFVRQLLYPFKCLLRRAA